MDKIKNFYIPSKMLSKSTFSQDDRFTHVKLSLCSHEEIANMMHFNKNLLESKMHQIDYMPIVGLIKIAEKSDGTVSYIMGDHETEYNIVDGEFIMTSKTVVLGVALPGTSKFEMITRNGETREYVTFEALLYSKKYPQLNGLVNENLDASMEISEVESHWNDGEGCYEVDNFKYDCHCLIGVRPAFDLAGVLEQFSMNDFKQEFADLLNEVKELSLNIMQEKSNEEGGNEVEEENKNTEVETEVDVAVKETDMADEATVEVVETDNPSTEETNMDESITGEEATNIGEEEEMKKKKKCKDEEVEKINYEEKFKEMLTAFEELKINLETLQSKYNDVNEKYQKYVKKEEDAKKQEMIDSFAGNLTQEEVEKCIDDISKFTVEEIETKLTLELGRKAKSEKQEVVFTETNEEQKEFVNFAKFDDNSYFAQLAKKIKGIK